MWRRYNTNLTSFILRYFGGLIPDASIDNSSVDIPILVGDIDNSSVDVPILVGDVHEVNFTRPIMNISVRRFVDILDDLWRKPIVRDGVRLNDNLWVRVCFTDWDHGIVHSYTLYANGLSPAKELLNESIGTELCGDMPLDKLPACIATPLHMRRVRGRDTETIRMPSKHVVWMNDLRVTVEYIIEITRRDKWEFHSHGEKLCAELVSLLLRQEHTKDSA